MDEFLKIKSPPPTGKIVTTKKRVISSRAPLPIKNLRGNVMMRKTAAAQSTTAALVSVKKQQDAKILSTNKSSYPLTFKDVTSEPQVLTQYNTKNVVVPASYIKLQPQITTVNGQQVVQLSPKNVSGTNMQTIGGGGTNHKQQTQTISAGQIIAVSGNSMIQSSNDTKTMFTTSSGQNVTITHQPLSTMNNSMQQSGHILSSPQPMQLIQIHQPGNSPDSNTGMIQLTTLQNVQAPLAPQPLPSKSGITIQRIKSDPITPPRKLIQSSPTNKTTTTPTTQPRAQLKSLPTFKTPTGNAPKAKTKFVAAAKTSTSTKPAKPQIAKNPVKTDSSINPPNPEAPSCSLCEKVFKRKEHLAQHMKLHLGLRPFKCDQAGCNKSFSRKEHLMRHVISHTGKKMFSCEFCQKLFSRKDNLNKHKR